MMGLVLSLVLIVLNDGRPYAPCQYDEAFQPVPCVWQANDRGNGQGDSFVALPIPTLNEEAPLLTLNIPHDVAGRIAQ